MPKTPLPDSDTPPDPRTELLADLDARIGEPFPAVGGEPAAAGDAAGGGFVRPEQVDLVLRLHQLGAAWRERVGKKPEAVSKRIDRFEIVREVGHGGFATVYEATDTLLGRTVALKVAHPEALVSPGLRRRFLREAELASKVTHPNLVTIHDIGASEGVTFIAEEFCDGGTLAAWLERHPGPVPPRLAAEIVRAIALGLDAAHERAVVHRDIKPSNILLTRGAGVGVIPEDGRAAISPTEPGWCVKLGDFGLGTLDDDTSADPLSRLTRAGATLGTPTWMAPEQIDRTIGPVGPATDVHALGLLLERLLVGGCRWIGGSDSETMRRILLREPDSIDRVFAGVPRDLVAVRRRCVGRTPGERYARAGDVAADLGRFLVGVPTQARPLSRWERACRTAARHPLAVASGALVAVAAMITGMALWGWSLQASAAARQRESLEQIGAALELQRGLADLTAGNSAAARTRISAVAALDEALDRSFAGRWARRRLRGERQVLFGDPDVAPTPDGPPRDLYCGAVSPDGTRIAAGGGDGRLVLLDADGGSPAIVVPEAHDEINDIAFSPDGRFVATVGEDGHVRLLSAEDGALQREIATEAMPLFAVTFTPDGERLAWSGAERTLELRSLDGGERTRFAVPLSVEPGGDGPDIESILFVDDGTVAIAGGAEVMLVSIADGSVIRRFEGHEGSVGSLDLSPDRTRLVSAGTDRIPRVWEIATGSLLAALPKHPNWVQGCVFTADGARIVTGCRDGVLQVFDASDGAFLERLPGHVGRTWDVRREPRGTVVSFGADGTLRRWSADHLGGVGGARACAVATRGVVKALPYHDRLAAPDGDTRKDVREHGLEVLVMTDDGAAVVVDPSTGRERLRLALSPRSTRRDAAIDGPRHRLALAYDGGAAVLAIDAPDDDGERTFHPEAHRLAWTPAGQLVTVSHWADGIVLGRNESLAEEVLIDRADQTLYAVAISRDGGMVAVGSPSRMRLTPIARQGTPRPVGRTRSIGIEASFGGMSAIAWAPDARRIAIGSNSGNVRILDAQSGETLHVISGHRSVVTALVWSADGRVVISADAESLRVTDSLTAVTIDSLAPGWTIRSVTLTGSPDTPDRWLVVGGDAAEEWPTAEGVPGNGRVLVVDLAP